MVSGSSAARHVPRSADQLIVVESVCYTLAAAADSDTLRQDNGLLTNVDTNSSVTALLGYSLAGAHQALAEPVHQLTIGGGQVGEKAVDRFDNDPPLR